MNLGALFHKSRAEREMDEEFRFHLEKQIEQNIAGGMSSDEARYTALRQFGNAGSIKEDCRDAWGVRFLNELLQDLRYGLRQLRRNPGFTIVAILTLALGIGATTAIFNIVDTVLLRPQPFKDPGQLVLLQEQNQGRGLHNITVTPADFADWRKENTVFQGLSGFVLWNPIFGTGQRAQQVPAVLCTPSLFTLLNTKAALGRTFLPEETRRAGQNEVVLSYGFWRGRFGGNPRIIGRTMTFNEFGFAKQYVIVGVMPPKFRFPYPLDSEQPDVWGALTTNPEDRGHLLSVVGRLKSGVSLRQAAAQMHTISARLEREYPKSNAGWQATLVSLQGRIVRNVRTVLLVLLGGAGFVLLMACIIVANLFLSQFEYRRKEFAVRTALGCSRTRLSRQLIAETELVSGLGGALGFCFAAAILPVCVHWTPPGFYIPRLAEVRTGGSVYLFALVASVLSALLVSIIPVLRLSELNLSKNLTAPQGMKVTRGIEVTARRRGPNLLVASGVAFAVVLLIGAGLMVRTMIALTQTDLGFKTRNLLTMQVTLPNSRYLEEPRRVAFLEEFLGKVDSLPGVKSAGVLDHFPPINFPLSFHVQGGVLPGTHSTGDLFAETHTVTPGYFSALGMRILKGRGLERSDNLKTPRVVIINQAMAHRFWPNRDPLGTLLTIQWQGKEPWKVVGVVSNIRGFDLRDEPRPEIYIPFYQAPSTAMSLIVRTRTDPRVFSGVISKDAWRIEKEARVGNVMTMDEFLSDSTSKSKLTMIMLSCFGGIALLLAVSGVFAQVSYHTSRRTHEIGIRMALGAGKRDVLGMVIRQGLKLTLIGVAIGIAGALALTRFLASLLYGVTPTDPLTFIAVSLILIAVALLACYVPARRAAKVDPMVALRHE